MIYDILKYLHCTTKEETLTCKNAWSKVVWDEKESTVGRICGKSRFHVGNERERKSRMMRVKIQQRK